MSSNFNNICQDPALNSMSNPILCLGPKSILNFDSGIEAEINWIYNKNELGFDEIGLGFWNEIT